MAIRNVVTEGDEILRKRCREVSEVTDRIRMTMEDMLETMREQYGVGIAAPQVGIMRRMFIAEPEPERVYYMINPGLFVVRVPGTSKMILGMLFYSVFSCYLVLRILEHCVKAKSDWLEKGLHIILYFIVMMLVFEIIIGGFGEIFVKEMTDKL